MGENDTRYAYAKRMALWIFGAVLFVAFGLLYYFFEWRSIVPLVIFFSGAGVMVLLAVSNAVKYSSSKIKEGDKVYEAEFAGSDYERFLKRDILFSIKVVYKNENGEECNGVTAYCFSLKQMQVYQDEKKLKIAVKPNGEIMILGLGG